ncbi:hypothetical protein VTN31DRAFT_1330 [Thermomyces dupontii]|uniref:uncharacterized protein n=1 Tax=Talaromyces thermophilus TaxID=28565 RepID=UPI0037420E57
MMGEEGQTEAQALAKRVQAAVQEAFVNKDTRTPDTKTPKQKQAPADKPHTATTPTFAQIVAKNTTPTQAKVAPTKTSKTDRPTRVFIRLPPDHPARRASVIDTTDRLRRQLPQPLPALIKGVQHIPTGLAIIPRDSQSTEQLLAAEEKSRTYSRVPG